MSTPEPIPPQPVQKKTNTLAIVGFVLAFFLSFVGAILGIISLNQIKQSGGAEGGKGLAIAAIVIGFLPILVIVILSLLGPAISNVFNNISGSLY